jgi:prophage regulatory protein
MKSLRLPAVKQAFGFESDGAVYSHITDGLLPKPVKVGPRASSWPVEEIQLMLTARAGGASDEEIRLLVAGIHERRVRAWATVRSQVLSATAGGAR